MKTLGGLPLSIDSGLWRGGHCQGIAADVERGYLYFSFTTMLLKTDLSGKPIGSVTGLLGHLGCIAFRPEENRVYGSLEYKGDEIGRGILRSVGARRQLPNAFYMTAFDCARIDRMDMDACRDGVMRAAYLCEVVSDYEAPNHRYGCSGIDGTTFGPAFGAEKTARRDLYVAYGVYGDVSREDNDHQVLLRYDTSGWDKYLRPLSQDDFHTSGPETPDEKLFLYTGNTHYGVQNLEYDPYTGDWLMAVYPGKKPNFPNDSLFVADGASAPVRTALRGLDGEIGAQIALKRGYRFFYGDTGLCALGEGLYYISRPYSEDGRFGSDVRLYRWDGETPFAEA